jgi:hypothetical protein
MMTVTKVFLLTEDGHTTKSEQCKMFRPVWDGRSSPSCWFYPPSMPDGIGVCYSNQVGDLLDFSISGHDTIVFVPSGT